jgi:hypothetical protein
MHTATVNIAGALVVPRMTDDMDSQRLTDAFASIGLKGPEARTPLAAIKAALLDLSGRAAGQTAVRLKDAEGYIVTQTEASLAEGVSATGTVSAYRYEDKGSPTGKRVKFDGPEEMREKFNGALRAAGGQVDRGDVVRSVVNALALMGATRVTENGGIYWVPDSALTRWATLAKGLEAASATRTARCHTIRTVGDADAIRAIAEAFTAQVDSEIAEVERDLAKDDVTDRVREARVERVGAIQNRIAMYEKELGTSLESLRERAAKATNREAQAAVLALNF